MSVYWLLSTYFGVLILRDMSIAPITYGKGLVPAVISAEAIAQIAWFVLLCNLSFMCGGHILFGLIAKRADYATTY